MTVVGVGVSVEPSRDRKAGSAGKTVFQTSALRVKKLFRSIQYSLELRTESDRVTLEHYCYVDSNAHSLAENRIFQLP